MVVVHLRCDNGHELAFDVPRPKGLLKLCEQGKRVCPHCKPENARLSPFQPEEISYVSRKIYTCKHGHTTELYPFTNGMINVTWGEEHENVPGVPEDVPGWIEDGTLRCRHILVNDVGRRRKCFCKLKPLDDSVLSYPNVIGIKTRTRVGDIWDKEGCPQPKESHHETFRRHGEEDARFVETEFSKRNKRRLRHIRRKRRTQVQGEVLRKPTNRSGEKLSKDQAIRGAREEYD